jgi:hypothetical protein
MRAERLTAIMKPLNAMLDNPNHDYRKWWTKKRVKEIKIYVRKNPECVAENGDPFQSAVDRGAPLELIKYLYERNKDAITQTSPGSLHYGWSALHNAVAANYHKPDIEIVKFLVENCPELATDFLTSRGLTALDIAVSHESPCDIVEYLLQKCPANVWLKDEGGNLPLYHAGNDNTVRLLLLAQIRADDGIRFENDDDEQQPPWGRNEDFDDCSFNLPVLSRLMRDNNASIKCISLKNVRFEQDDWTDFANTLVNLTNLRSFEMENVAVADKDSKLVEHFLPADIRSTLLANNKNLATLRLEGVESHSGEEELEAADGVALEADVASPQNVDDVTKYTRKVRKLEHKLEKAKKKQRLALLKKEVEELQQEVDDDDDDDDDDSKSEKSESQDDIQSADDDDDDS